MVTIIGVAHPLLDKESLGPRVVRGLLEQGPFEASLIEAAHPGIEMLSSLTGEQVFLVDALPGYPLGEILELPLPQEGLVSFGSPELALSELVELGQELGDLPPVTLLGIRVGKSPVSFLSGMVPEIEGAIAHLIDRLKSAIIEQPDGESLLSLEGKS